MTILAPTAPRSTAEAPARPVASRDAVIDLVRGGLLAVVVVLHALMAGITVDTDGVHIVNALEGQPGFAVASWLVQVMPLFFVVGGFAGIAGWRAARARGTTPAAFAAGRLRRLGIPAALLFGTIAVGLAIATTLGAPAELLGELGFRMAQPMWFLAVYLGASALVPLMVGLHERAPRTALAALVALATVIDAVRISTGVEAIGLLNLAFVWLALQQLGFLLADGWFARRTRFELALLVATPLLGMLVLMLSGSYAADMFVNLNPPTIMLILIGVAQTAALTLARPALERVVRRPFVGRFVDVVNRHSMTVYLWHMPALVVVAALALGAGFAWPDPLSGSWWLTRPLWIAAILALLVPATAWLGRFERASARGTATPRVVMPVIIAIAGVITVLVAGFTPLSAALGFGALVVAIAAVSGPASRARTRTPQSLPAPGRALRA